MASAGRRIVGRRGAHERQQRRRRRRGRHVGRGAGRLREGLEELARAAPATRARRRGWPPRVRGPGPSGKRRRDGRQRHRELALDVPVLLRVGGQLALGEGAGLPATVEGVREQVTPDNRLRQHLVDPLSVHCGTLSSPAPGHLGRPGPAAGHNRGVLSLVCFLVGGLLGWGAAQGGTRVQRVWPVVLRVQILVTSATLSLVAAWRLTSVGRARRPARPVRRAVAHARRPPWPRGAGAAPARVRSRPGRSAPTAGSGSSRRPPPSPDRPGR